MQHVVSAIAYRTQGDGGKAVEVDAGGYRERRKREARDDGPPGGRPCANERRVPCSWRP